jgi:arylsulfatase A-like enzyme
MKKLLLTVFVLFTLLSFRNNHIATKPNIIIVLADDLGYGDLGCFGSKVIQTPHLDQLASEGLRLTQFYSGSTVCAPSRCTLFTGKHTGHAYIRGNGDVPLRKQDLILPEIFKKNGYKTGLFGKWGMGDVNTSGSPNLKGWDTFFGFLLHVEGHYQVPTIGWQSTPEAPIPQRINTRFTGYACDQFTEEALNWLKKQDKNQPFLMELALTVPHAELYAPKDAMKRYQDAQGNSIFNEKPFEGSHYGGQTQPQAAYCAMVSKADEYVGQIIETLKKQGLDNNTLVIFTSDNGTHIEGGRRLEDVKSMNSTGPLRGVKRDMYEGGIRVPTVVWGLGLPKGVVRDGQGAFWDLLPTFMDVAGIKTKIETDGISLYKHWQTGDALTERPLYWEFHEGRYAQAVRLGDWKFIQTQLKNQPLKQELFDLKNDIGETDNLVLKNPKQAEIMQQYAQKLYLPSEHPSFRPLR